MDHFRLFVMPFWIGAAFLLLYLVVVYVKWFVGLKSSHRSMFWRSLPTTATLKSIWEVIKESLLHLKIWKRNPVLGYMHTTFALGWFLLILIGWIETHVYFNWQNVPLYVDIFFSYYVHPVFERNFNFSLIKDALLLLLLIGVAMALFKRVRSKMMGMKRTTNHFVADRIALTALWTIFPARLLAESMTSGVVWRFGGVVEALSDHPQVIEPGVGCGSFLTNTTGELLATILSPGVLRAMELPSWWLYSIALGVFLFSLPFSRYMHIFTEIPVIFLRNAGIRSGETPCSFDNFQIQACSRCGICIDPCQLQSDAAIGKVQAVYFLRSRRYGVLTDKVANNCLMCGRCDDACPVGIDLKTLRLNSRQRYAVPIGEGRYDYFPVQKPLGQDGAVGYFAGCMTLLTPKILRAMETIFEASGDKIWWADRDGGVCCGRPLKLSGEVEAARKMIDYNRELFVNAGVKTLVTSCPICLKVFKEDYALEGIEILHHSEYIARLIAQGKIEVEKRDELLTYHDPCELGRGAGIYDAPREVILSVAKLAELSENRVNGLCCGSSLANLSIDDQGQQRIANKMGERFSETGALAIVTSCPLCKKAIGRGASMPVYDLAEVVAGRIRG